MKKLLSSLVLCALVAIPGSSSAQSLAEFYKDKKLNMIIGFGPGGGYDQWARVVARHMSKHLPGNPTFVPQNMPGAGSLTAANHLYSVAPKDGTTIGIIARDALTTAHVDGLAEAVAEFHLRAVRAAVAVPLLAKEFVVDERQLPLLRAAGADLVLLLAVLHPPKELARLVEQATRPRFERAPGRRPHATPSTDGSRRTRRAPWKDPDQTGPDLQR